MTVTEELVAQGHAVIRQMREAGFPLNHDTYNELINAVGRPDRCAPVSQVWDIIDEVLLAEYGQTA